ncbi:MAG: TonB family protein [Paraglaciecola sp.]|jgi:TonB family protein
MQKERKSKHFLAKPSYPGGPKALKVFISENIKYPTEALAAKIEGSVTLKYSMDNKGKVISARVISGLSHGCNEEAIRLVKLLKFTEARNRGVRAIFHKDVTIHFRLPKEKATVKIPIMEPTEMVVPPKQEAQDIQYVVTTSKPKSEEKAADKKDKDKGGYSYTIDM